MKAVIETQVASATDGERQRDLRCQEGMSPSPGVQDEPLSRGAGLSLPAVESLEWPKLSGKSLVLSDGHIP